MDSNNLQETTFDNGALKDRNKPDDAPSTQTSDGKYIASKRPESLGLEEAGEQMQTVQLSARRWLIAPYSFLFMAASTTSYFTFSQFLYAKVQSDLYPNMTSDNARNSCASDQSSISHKEHTHVQETVAMWNMYFSISGAIPAIFSNIFFGSMTDQYGRKFLLFLPCIGVFIRALVTFLGIYFNFDLKYHIIGHVAEGLTGQAFSMLLVCFTYVADITKSSAKQRTFGITMMELSIGIAVTIFNFIDGFFIKAVGFFYTMLFSGLLLCAAAIVSCFIPESFVKSKESRDSSIYETFTAAIKLFVGPMNMGYRWVLNTLLFVFTITLISQIGRSSIDPVYQLGPPFCWSPEKLGYYGALRGFLQQAVGIGLIKLLQRLISDETIAMVGCVSSSAGFILQGLADSDAALYIVPVVGALGLLTIPICRSLMSKQTHASQQGALFAVHAAMESAAGLAGTVITNEIYSNTVSSCRGCVFYVLTSFNAVCLLLLWIYRFKSKRFQTYTISGT